MKIAVLSRHGRLLALCGLSALLHLLVLQLAVRHGTRTIAAAPGGAEPLVLRLAPAVRAAAPADGVSPPPLARAAVPPSRPLPVTRVRARAAVRALAAPHTTPDAAEPPSIAGAPASAVGAGGGTSGDVMPLQLPARYRVRMPPSVRLVYRLTRRDAVGNQEPAQAALLDWRNESGHYTLLMKGVLGQLSSSGEESDSGIQPQRFAGDSEKRHDDIVFDPQQHRVVFADGSEAPDAPGMQDRASLLMQLAGIGLARPGQMQDVIELVVADAGNARIERFQVVGEEQVETGAGAVPALRLVQLAAAGEPRLEVWLAPGQGWLPVQLRVTEADGSGATQVLARTEAPAP